MADYRYLCPTVVDPEDTSSVLPVILAEFPNLSVSVEDRITNPSIPEGRVLATVTGINANMHRAILAVAEVSEYR